MDDWGKDPSVQRMRKIFSMMERIDQTLIQDTGLSPFDRRLRNIREMSRGLFQKSFSHCMSKGIHLDEKDTIELFKKCHIIAFRRNGISMADIEPPEENAISAIVQEVS